MVSPSSAEWPVPAADDFQAEEVAPDSELPVKQGDVLAGRYAVERVLASGGMGVVCLGKHVELDQPVAVKFLRRELAQNPAVVQRFLNEARAAASLRSEHGQWSRISAGIIRRGGFGWRGERWHGGLSPQATRVRETAQLSASCSECSNVARPVGDAILKEFQ